MPGTHAEDQSRAGTLVQPRPRKRYIVVRREDVWFIIFGGEEFGPYKTEREAKLFAIDAAYKLGEQGEETEVMVSSDEAGAVSPIWVYGQHAYPPRE
jgi:hypothetical protein